MTAPTGYPELDALLLRIGTIPTLDAAALEDFRRPASPRVRTTLRPDAPPA